MGRAKASVAACGAHKQWQRAQIERRALKTACLLQHLNSARATSRLNYSLPRMDGERRERERSAAEVRTLPHAELRTRPLPAPRPAAE
eukprot:2422988-Pleurochrysis_carterae.AAC.1